MSKFKPVIYLFMTVDNDNKTFQMNCKEGTHRVEVRLKFLYTLFIQGDESTLYFRMEGKVRILEWNNRVKDSTCQPLGYGNEVIKCALLPEHKEVIKRVKNICQDVSLRGYGISKVYQTREDVVKSAMMHIFLSSLVISSFDYQLKLHKIEEW